MQAPGALASHASESAKFYARNPVQLKTELLNGLAVAIMQVPESSAFAFTAGIAPMQGLQSTFFIGLFAAALGGMSGMISGMAGAMAVVQNHIVAPTTGALVELCSADRLQILYMTMFVTGVMQILLGVFQAHKLLRLLPYPVHVGFANGLAIVIGLAQLTAFKVTDTSNSAAAMATLSEPAGCPPSVIPTMGPQRWLSFGELELWLVLLLVLLAMVAMEFQPRIRGTLRLGPITVTSRVIPSSLTAMILTTLVEHLVYRLGFGVRTKTVGDVATLRGAFLPFAFPSLPLGSPHWGTVFRFAATLTAIGSVESLMTLELCAGLAKREVPRHAGFQEQVAQGLGNLVASLFSTIGGSAMVGQSSLNVMAGSRGRLGSVTASLWILLIIAVAGPAIELLPVASLTGILFIVVIHTFEWRTWRYLFRREMRWQDSVTVLLVSVLAVVADLAIGVLTGVLWSAVVFAWESASLVRIDRATSDIELTIRITGPVFFTSASTMERQLAPAPADPRSVTIDLAHARLHDHSAVAVLQAAAKTWFRTQGGHMRFVGVDAHGRRLLVAAGAVTSIHNAAESVYFAAKGAVEKEALAQDRESGGAVVLELRDQDEPAGSTSRERLASLGSPTGYHPVVSS
ncbi:hypothetical protein H9P43_000675 [Blastocladiella emersonii ATCC 22665]|nr:hypothetical protein H9P43_000675 [Blastocladiella emersonii ATCC 22665]